MLGCTKNMQMIIIQKGFCPTPFGPWSTAKYLIDYMKGNILRFTRD